MNELQHKILSTIVAESDTGRPPLGDIYGIQGSESPWAIATNGQFILAFAVDSLEAIEPLENPVTKVLKTVERITGWLDHAEGLQEISFPALLTWCKAGEFLRCPCCDGSGKREVDLGNKFVEGNWKDDFRNLDAGSFGRLAGLPVSRNLMVKTLAYLPPQGIVSIGQVSGAGADKSPAILIAGDGWRYIQCGLTQTPDEVEKLERFNEPT